MNENNRGTLRQLELISSRGDEYLYKYYKVGNRDIIDYWLSQSQEPSYSYFITKTFELLNGLACLQYLNEKDNDNVIQIDKIQKQIEYINNCKDFERQAIRNQKHEKINQELIFDTSQQVPFHKKSKILGKSIVRLAHIEKQCIRVIYHSKNKYLLYQINDQLQQYKQFNLFKYIYYKILQKDKKILHDNYIYQIEKIEFDQMQDARKQFQNNQHKQNRVKVIKSFYSILKSDNIDALPSSLKWVDLNYNYRMIIKNPTPQSQLKFENALYFSNFSDVQKVGDLIRVSRSLFTQNPMSFRCGANFKLLFRELSKRWKGQISSQVLKQMDKYIANEKVIQQNYLLNQQSFIMNTSQSQDYYINRNSKQLLFRNNYSYHENQQPLFLNDLQIFKDRSSMNENQLFNNYNNNDERDKIIKQFTGSNLYNKNQDENFEKGNPNNKKENIIEEFGTPPLLFSSSQKEKTDKSEAFENYLRSNAKSNIKELKNNSAREGKDGYDDYGQIKLKGNFDFEDDGLPKPIQKQIDLHNMSDDSFNIENFIDQKQRQEDEMQQQNEMKRYQNKYNNSQEINMQNTSSQLKGQKPHQNKQVYFQQLEPLQTDESKIMDSQSYELNYDVLMHDSQQDQNKRMNNFEQKPLNQLQLNQEQIFSQQSNMSLNKQLSSGRGDIQDPTNTFSNRNQRTNIQTYKNQYETNNPNEVEKPKRGDLNQDYRSQIEQKNQEVQQTTQDSARNKQTSIINQLVANGINRNGLDPLQEEPELTSVGSITPSNSLRFQTYTFANISRKNTKNQFDSEECQNSQQLQNQQQQLSAISTQTFGGLKEDNIKKAYNIEQSQSVKNPGSIIDYLDQQKINSTRSISISSTGQKNYQIPQNENNGKYTQPEAKLSIDTNTFNSSGTPNSVDVNMVGPQQITSFRQYQKEKKYQEESAILENQKRKSQVNIDEIKTEEQYKSFKNEQFDSQAQNAKYSSESSKHEIQMISNSSRNHNSQQHQEQTKEKVLEIINQNKGNLTNNNNKKNSSSDLINCDEGLSFYLQKMELISPTQEFPPEVQIEMYLYNLEIQSIQSQHTWKEFIKPITRCEDNFIYEIEENYKEIAISINNYENYQVHVMIKSKFNSELIGNIAIKLTDILDFENPGKDFWLICPVVFPNIPFALINLWTSLHQNCDNYKQNIFQIYSCINSVKNPIYQTYVHFPEVKIEDLKRIQSLTSKMGYKQQWLSDDLFEDQSNNLLNGNKLKELKRQLQYGYMNKIGYYSANLFIQENIYNQLLSKLKEKSLPKNEIINHFHSLCLEGIPYTKRQEIYLELLDLKDKIEKIREDFISYCSFNPAKQDEVNNVHTFNDVYVSYELNQSGKEVRTLLNDFNFTAQRDNFYQVLYSEAKYYDMAFDIDYKFVFDIEDCQMAYKIFRTLSFVMKIQRISIQPQFYSAYHHLLNKCLILNSQEKNSQESESFWLIYCILSTFNSNRQLLTRYFHLIECSTNFQRISNIIGMECLIGLFSGCFHDELCFRCWDVIFMEEKRKSWDILGYLTSIGIAICNQFQIKNEKDWEIFGKYYCNFTELTRLTKNTYETLIGNENNYKRWIDKQLFSEQLRQKSVKKYENQRLLVSKYVHNFNINFNTLELENLINELLQNNYYVSKYDLKKILKEKKHNKYQLNHINSSNQNQQFRNQISSQSPYRVYTTLNMPTETSNQELQTSYQNSGSFSTPKLNSNINKNTHYKNNSILSNESSNSDMQNLPQFFDGGYYTSSGAKLKGETNYQFNNQFNQQNQRIVHSQIRQFSPVKQTQNVAQKKSLINVRSNSNESQISQLSQEKLMSYRNKDNSRKSGDFISSINNKKINQKDSEESDDYKLLVGQNKSNDFVLEIISQSEFEDRDEEFVFKKENLHVFITRLICRDENSHENYNFSDYQKLAQSNIINTLSEKRQHDNTSNEFNDERKDQPFDKQTIMKEGKDYSLKKQVQFEDTLEFPDKTQTFGDEGSSNIDGFQTSDERQDQNNKETNDQVFNNNQERNSRNFTNNIKQRDIKELLDQVRQQANTVNLRQQGTFQKNNKNIQNISYWLQVGGREMSGEDCEKIEKYQFFEGTENTPILRMRTCICNMFYCTDIDLRAFNRNTMYHQISFMQEDSQPDQIIVEFNIYIESFSLNDNFSLRPVLQQQAIQQYISRKQKKNSTNNSQQALQGVYNATQLHNDVCINSSFTNTPIERFEEFESYYNNQILLQSSINHFIYSKNILTRNHRVFKIFNFMNYSDILNTSQSTNPNKYSQNSLNKNLLNPSNYNQSNNILEQMLINIVEPPKQSQFKNLIRDLNENDAVEIIQFLLLYLPCSYEKKLKILYNLFVLRFPQQTSDDLDSYLMNFCLKTDMSFYSFRDLQCLLQDHTHETYSVTQAIISFDSGSVYDVSNFFINQIVNKICDTYLLDNFNISQPFIIEKILQYIDNLEYTQQNDDIIFSPTKQRPNKKIIDYNINLNSHEQIKLHSKLQTPFDAIHPIPFDSRDDSNKIKNKFNQYNNDFQEQNEQIIQNDEHQEGKLDIYYKFEGKIVKKEVEFLINEFKKVQIITDYDTSVKSKEIFSKNQLVIRNKAICFPLTQFRNWINLKPYIYIADFETFKKYIKGSKLLEVYLMKNSPFIHPSLPLTTTIPFIIQATYNDITQSFCDYIFVNSNVHNQLIKQIEINYLPYLTLDDSILLILSRIFKFSQQYVKKCLIVFINSNEINNFDVSLKTVVSEISLINTKNLIQISIKEKNNLSSSKKNSPNKTDNKSINNSPVKPKYSQNGYSVWNICSNRQYLPCKVLQPNQIKYKKTKIVYNNPDNVIKWY